ncbi:uncharacterized protein Z518_04651 [Rhinocladiella mackenziei CBS 650.93]|uniref:Uncharacterized protein n=1 Tax=Rhinocladiella mackenziei CBS 650.93 TaxID=1442369 RepID=A0A0D2JC51_9EURO|nr:uncharacterized protein Z518_04651 [Rhinocladiella mackenziei CBS 650.93]KIX06675.1 hypothetical protein Z518_04651 [Rhinocladiella mackenziei CBS 650.93]
MASELRPGNRTGRSVVRPPFSFSKSEPKARTSAQPKNTNLSRGLRRAYSSAYSPQFSADKIKETDPDRIKLLWREVVEKNTPRYTRQTLASQSRNQAQSNVTPKSTLPTSVSKSSTPRTEVPKTATVRDADFKHTQLFPRGLEISSERPSLGGAHTHFGSKTPPNAAKSCEFYRCIVQEALAGRADRDIDDSIFLPMDTKFVTSVLTAYGRMGKAGVSEAEFQGYACQKLFIGPYAVLEDDVERQLGAVRCVEVPLKPRESRNRLMWGEPPMISKQPPLKPFSFDTYADCQFWLSDKIINPEYRLDVKHIVHMKELGTFCPYFSIEFKATTCDRQVADNQVLVDGLASLFNRYQLKVDAFPHPAPEQFKLVRHYGLTMEKDSWTVWLFQPKIVKKTTWAGCRVRILGTGSCETNREVLALLEWINEIHRWGLCEYALGCEEDIKQILSKDSSNLRISAIGVSKETETVETGMAEEV